jgi:hypothetical protein
MLRAHSLLWHYLWVAPNVLLLLLGFLIWKRGIARSFPAFCVFAVLTSAGRLALYGADIAPWISGPTFWKVDWFSLAMECVLKCAVIAEIFAHVFGPYASLAGLGKMLIRAVGVILVFAAALAASFTPKDGKFGIISGAHILEQTIHFIVTGLLAFIFIFAAYFHLRLEPRVFGIALGLAITACIHLGTWALLANGGLPEQTRRVLDMVNMLTFHASVLVWLYYLLVRRNVNGKPPKPPASLPENHLAVWNRELERLLHQ